MTERKIILGIESSCDETSCSLVADGTEVLSNVVASQIDLHTRFGGVVPELASRAHIEAINTVIQQAIEQSGLARADISAIAVTNEPGLIGSLLIGVMAAKTLAWAWQLPLIGVNHVYAHAYAAALNADPIQYPAVALICSGGHTALYRCAGPTEMELLGTTIDDAAGEAFDKVASILHLGYPGGPIIDKLARQANPNAVAFPRSLLGGQSLDFSFSGIKTAVLYHVNGVPGKPVRPGEVDKPKGIENLSAGQVADIAASFQAAVVDVLRIKVRRAIKLVGAKTLTIGGGVAANSALRNALAQQAGRMHCTLRLPEFQYCLDNAAMTAGLAYHYLLAGQTAGLDLEAHATVKR
jgi:N6-L-threonylcarbamoyladenine synthase